MIKMLGNHPNIMPLGRNVADIKNMNISVLAIRGEATPVSLKIQNIFKVWLCHQKQKNDNKAWYWLVNDYKKCYEQRSPSEYPNISSSNGSEYTSFNFSSEAIKIYFKTPSAIVLEANDFEILFKELMDLDMKKNDCSAHLLQNSY